MSRAREEVLDLSWTTGPARSLPERRAGALPAPRWPAGDPSTEAIWIAGARGLDLLLAGDPRGGGLLGDALEGLPPGPPRATLLAVLALGRAHLGEREILELLRRARPGSGAPEASPAGGVRASPPASRGGVRVRVALDGAGLWRADGEWVALRRRRVLRGLLGALAAALRDRPGVALGHEELIGQVWPDERKPGCASAVNRFHVALSALRRLGLGEGLCSTRRGWLLSPERVGLA